MADILTILLAFLPSLLYALGGALDAYNKKEKIDAVVFAKTLVIGGVAAGALSQQSANLLTDFLANSAVVTLLTIVADKIVNGLLKKP